jgi:photosystem II stability/assembly factor-like uncharacterized protein
MLSVRSVPRREGPEEHSGGAVNPSRPGEVYATTGDGTIYRSTDGGRTWMAGR